MVTSNPISDMLIRIKNGYMAKSSSVVVPWSKTKQAICNLLVKQNYLESLEVKVDGSKKDLVLKLKYDQKEPVLTDVKIVSRPSLRVYAGKDKLPRVLGGLGLAIISTPLGVLTDKEARLKNVGGEVICEIW